VSDVDQAPSFPQLPFRVTTGKVVFLAVLFVLLNFVPLYLFRTARTESLRFEAATYLERCLLVWEGSKAHDPLPNFFAGTFPEHPFIKDVCLGGTHAGRRLKDFNLEEYSRSFALYCDRPELAGFEGGPLPHRRPSFEGMLYAYPGSSAQTYWRRALFGGLLASGILLLAVFFFVQWLVPRLRAGPRGSPGSLSWHDSLGAYFLATSLALGVLLILDAASWVVFPVTDPWYTIFSILVFQVLSCLLMVWWLSGSWRASAEHYRFRTSDFASLRNWRWAGLVFLVFWVAGWLFYAIGMFLGRPTLLDSLLHARSLAGPMTILASMVGGVICAPLFEEIVFRGYVLDGLENRLGFWWAAILGSALFSIIHFYSPLGFLDIFLFGVLQCVVVRKTGSLAPAIIGHFLINASLFVPDVLMFWPLGF